MAIAEVLKVPAAILDYAIVGPANDSLVSGAWTVPAGLTKASESFVPTAARVRLSGGTAGNGYRCSALAVGASGQQYAFVLTVVVVARIVVKEFTLRIGEVLDYPMGWSSDVVGDTIVSHAWAATGLTITGATNTAMVRLSGSTVGEFYATDHIATVSGQEDERSILVRVRDV